MLKTRVLSAVIAGASQAAFLADAGNTGSGMECRIDHSTSQLATWVSTETSALREFHSGDQECPQPKTERWKVQAVFLALKNVQATNAI